MSAKKNDMSNEKITAGAILVGYYFFYTCAYRGSYQYRSLDREGWLG